MTTSHIFNHFPPRTETPETPAIVPCDLAQQRKTV